MFVDDNLDVEVPRALLAGLAHCNALARVPAQLDQAGGESNNVSGFKQIAVLVVPDQLRIPADVAADDRAGAREMTEYLLDLGHQRIGFVVGSPVQIASEQRLDGYRDALAGAGGQLDPRLVLQGDFDFVSGLEAGRVLLARGEGRPTAIFASNDDMAAGVLAAAHEIGIDVPGELSVAGFDDTPLASQVWPALTTVHQPVYDIAARATEIVIAALRGETPDQAQPILPTRLIIRQSTAAPVRR